MQAVLEFLIFFFFLVAVEPSSLGLHKGGGWGEEAEREASCILTLFFAMEIINRKTMAGGLGGPEGVSCSLSRLPNVLIIACHWKKATY